MSISKTLQISASSLAAERLRMQTIASNMANARTTRTEEGGPYKRRMPVFEATQLDPFGTALTWIRSLGKTTGAAMHSASRLQIS